MMLAAFLVVVQALLKVCIIRFLVQTTLEDPSLLVMVLEHPGMMPYVVETLVDAFGLLDRTIRTKTLLGLVHLFPTLIRLFGFLVGGTIVVAVLEVVGIGRVVIEFPLGTVGMLDVVSNLFVGNLVDQLPDSLLEQMVSTLMIGLGRNTIID